MYRMKRKGVAVAALAASALVLTGCTAGGDSANEDGVTTILAVVWPGPEGDAMEIVADEYNADQGKEDKVEVQTVLLGREDTFNKEATEMAVQSSQFDVYWTASYILEQHAPHLEPLNDIDTGIFFPTAVDAMSIDGNVMALPLDVSMHYTFYRQDLMDELLNNEAEWEKFGDISEQVVGERLQPVSPQEWTWDDFSATAAYFTKTLNPDSPTEFGTAIAAKNTPFNVMFWNNVLWGNGGNWMENDEPALDSDAAMEAMEVYRTAFENGLVSPDSTQGDFNFLQSSMQSGSIALMHQWVSGFATLNDPEMSPATAGKIGVAPVPGQKAHVHFLAAAMNKYSEKKEAAMKWLEYLATEDAQTAYAQAGGIPSVSEVLLANADQNPMFEYMAEDVDKYGYVEPRFENGTQYQAFVALGDALSGGWINSESAEAALEKGQQALAELAGN